MSGSDIQRAFKKTKDDNQSFRVLVDFLQDLQTVKGAFVSQEMIDYIDKMRWRGTRQDEDYL